MDFSPNPNPNKRNQDQFCCDLPNPNPNPNPNKRNHDQIYFDLPLSKRFKAEDLIDLLDDVATGEVAGDVAGEAAELESVMRSFEEEIAGDGELRFLLHASDDELGLPPPSGSPEKAGRVADVAKVVADVVDDVAGRVDEVELGFESGVYGWCEDGFGPLDLAGEMTWQVMPAVQVDGWIRVRKE